MKEATIVNNYFIIFQFDFNDMNYYTYLLLFCWVMYNIMIISY